MEEQQDKKININLTPDVANGTYANLAVIAHSQSEFVLDFISTLPGQRPTVKSRIIMPPGNVKRLLAALAQNVENYERQHGPVQDGQTQDISIPFGFSGNKGDA